LLDLTSSAASNMRAAERGWDWDIFAIPEMDPESIRTIDSDIADRKAKADLAAMLPISRRMSARKHDRSEEE
jgi:hypothetical protein